MNGRLEQVAQLERSQARRRHSRARAGADVQHGAQTEPQHAHANEGQPQPAIERAVDELARAQLQCFWAG